MTSEYLDPKVKTSEPEKTETILARVDELPPGSGYAMRHPSATDLAPVVPKKQESEQQEQE